MKYQVPFGVTRPGIGPRSLGPLANALSTRPMNCANYLYWIGILDIIKLRANYLYYIGILEII